MVIAKCILPLLGVKLSYLVQDEKQFFTRLIVVHPLPFRPSALPQPHCLETAAFKNIKNFDQYFLIISPNRMKLDCVENTLDNL